MDGLLLLGRRQQGVATVLVLSLVAGLSLMVTAMVGTSRRDMQLLFTQREQMQSIALLEGAAHLLMRQFWANRLTAESAETARAFSQGVVFAGKRLSGSVYPVEALIDLRSAPAPVIETLLVKAGGMDRIAAGELALLIVRYREQAEARGDGDAISLAHLHDLMAVRGMRREVLDQIGFAVRVSGAASPALNRTSMPAELARSMGIAGWGGEEQETDSAASSEISSSPSSGGGAMVQVTLSYEPEEGRVARAHFRISLDESQYGIPWRIKQRFPLEYAQSPLGGEK
jgi:hypothetical protein